MSASGESPRTAKPRSGSATARRTRNGSPYLRGGGSASPIADSPHGAIASGERGQWQWLASNGTWQDFNANSCRMLERARARDRAKCTVSAACGRIEVDLQRMMQRMYSNASVEHKVRRFDPVETENVGDSGGGERREVATTRPAMAASSAVARTGTAVVAPTSPSGAAPKRVPVARGGSRRRSASSSNSPAAKAGAAASRRALRSAGTAVVSQPGSGFGSGNGGASGFAASAAVMADDDVALSLALALSLAGEDMPTRGDGGRNRNYCDNDEALAQLLALEQQNLNEDAFVAAIAASQGGTSSEPVARQSGAVDSPKPSKPQLWQLDQLPKSTVPPSGTDDEDDECAVCCDDYHPGDELRTLPCLHKFHAACIDDWLLSDMPGARNCPMCNTEVQF
eukprot:TRINITY_DN32485_c0_g1_i1.p1 TRINITY_DN32485_c0_g1~~TRINITY_DN32485_c0_g1_i1.p1  ORF type:complete len:397 (-),score=77.04 TRINITY_DN32485_c0_g1_i1:75-1265(-)